jgi:isopenicillin N synthase-like dioxygenase
LTPHTLCAAYLRQVRPSTGTPDLKESYQCGYTAAAAVSWPSEAAAPGFRAACERFMSGAAAVSDVLLRALALALDMPEEALVAAHNPAAPDVQTALRLLYYPPLAGRTDVDVAHGDRWRAGAHTDFDVLTLLFQRPGEDGLELCPGRAASTEFAHGDTWLPVPPVEGTITCNIGDMLMRWSDDTVVSTFHRVRAPAEGTPESTKARYSIAYFNQACESTLIQGAAAKYPPLTGREFLATSIARNFSALQTRAR